MSGACDVFGAEPLLRWQASCDCLRLDEGTSSRKGCRGVVAFRLGLVGRCRKTPRRCFPVPGGREATAGKKPRNSSTLEFSRGQT